MLKRRSISVILIITVFFYGMRLCGIFNLVSFEEGTVLAKTIQKDGKIVPVSTKEDGKGKNISPFKIKKNKKIKKTIKESNYIVMTDSDNAVKMLEAEYDLADTISSTSLELIEEQKLTVVKMSGMEASALQESSNVLRIEEDVDVKASDSIKNRKVVKKKPKKGETEWNVQAIKSDKVNRNTSSKKIKIAVIDSGVDEFNDIEVSERINLIPGEEEVLPLFYDVSGHGSSVAGIIAAQENDIGITGINPNVDIYSVKVLGNDNTSPVSRIIEGIYWSIEQQVDIINMSFGTNVYSCALEKAVKDAHNAGILLVAAAGNTGELGVQYPAAFDEVISVGSIDCDGMVSNYSAKGEQIDLVAPGSLIKSTGAFEGVVITDGTSMAAPHVSAAASLILEKDNSVSPDFVRRLLMESANLYGEENEYGAGVLDVSYALKYYYKFKESYALNEQVDDVLSENQTEVISFHDLDYVSGSWFEEDHEDCIDNTGSMSAAEIGAMKAGVIYPDNKYTVMAGVGDHPLWHGGYAYAGTSNYVNYVSSYIYITRIAMAIKRGGTPSIATVPSGLSSSDATRIRDAINDVNWSSLVRNINEKGAYIWGMAIHTATDVFAHSVYGYFTSKKRWEQLDHGTNNGMADKVDKYLGRFETAKEVGKASVARYRTGTSGTASEFNPGNSNSYKKSSNQLTNESWLVRSLSPYTYVHDPSVSAAIMQYSYIAPFK